MSEFFEQQHQDSMSKNQIEQLQPHKQEFKLLGKQRVIPGHTLFSYNILTHEVKVAPIKYEVAIDYKTGKPFRKRTYVIEKNCIYRQALNKKNFLKRLMREKYIQSH